MDTLPDSPSDDSKEVAAKAQAMVKAFHAIDRELARKTGKRFHQALHHRMQLYSCDGLDALHDLAVMPVVQNPMLMQVKYMAAAKLAVLRGEHNIPAPPSDVDQTLKRLNDAYQTSAPRIKRVRERIIEFEQEPKPDEPITIEGLGES